MESSAVLTLIVAATLVGFALGWILSRRLAPKSGSGESAFLITELDRVRNELSREQDRAKAAELESAVSLKELEMLKTRLEEQKTQLTTLEERFRTEFKNIANDLLEDKSRKFTLQNKENLDALLSPLGKKIEEFKTRVNEVYQQENNQRQQLTGEIRLIRDLNNKISEQTRSLTEALRMDTKAQGSWGEVVLQRILERSGLREGHEYETQQSHTNEEGRRLQPDVVVRLPGSKFIVVDSKVSLTAYERFVSEENPELRDEHMGDHVKSIRTHVRTLKSKRYDELLKDGSPDFVLMFIPIESAHSVALQADAELYSDAFSENIILVSPTTLMATLATIDTVWKREYQSQNAIEIAKRGGQLVDKFAGFVESLMEIGNRLDQARQSYDTALGRLSEGRGNLVSQAKMLKQLGVRSTKELPDGLLREAFDDEDAADTADTADTAVTSNASGSDAPVREQGQGALSRPE